MPWFKQKQDQNSRLPLSGFTQINIGCLHSSVSNQNYIKIIFQPYQVKLTQADLSDISPLGRDIFNLLTQFQIIWSTVGFIFYFTVIVVFRELLGNCLKPLASWSRSTAEKQLRIFWRVNSKIIKGRDLNSSTRVKHVFVLIWNR